MRPPILTRPFLILMFAQAAFGFSMSAYFLVPKYMAAELGADASAIGIVTASYSAAAVLCLFGFGSLVDRYGRRPFLIAGSVLMAASSLAFPFVDEVGPLLVGLRVAQAAAFAMAFVGGATLAVDLAPPERLGQAIGIFGLTMLSMNAVAPAVVEAVADARGWPTAFAVAAGGALLACALAPLVREARRTSTEPAPGLLAVARRPHLLRAAAIMTLVGAIFGTLFTFNQPFALELGIEHVREFFIGYTAMAMLARLGFGGLADRLGRHRVAAATLLLYGVACLAMTALGTIGLLPVGALFGIAHGFFYPAYNALVVEATSVDSRGKVMAVFQGWFNVGFGGGALALGFVADAAGYVAVFLVAALGSVVALGLLVRSPEGRGANAPGVRSDDEDGHTLLRE